MHSSGCARGSAVPTTKPLARPASYCRGSTCWARTAAGHTALSEHWATKRDDLTGQAHRHDRPDPSPDWQDHPGLLPAIDQWGYIDQYASMHVSSLSVLIQTMTTVIESAFVPAVAPDPMPRPAAWRRIIPEEEAAIFVRADELNARIAELLEQYD